MEFDVRRNAKMIMRMPKRAAKLEQQHMSLTGSFLESKHILLSF